MRKEVDDVGNWGRSSEEVTSESRESPNTGGT